MEIIGRKTEQATLERYLTSDKPEFLAVFGRRRVGKTFLVREFYKNSLCFSFTGKANATLKEQLAEFDQAVLDYCSSNHTKAKSWPEAFRILREIIESAPVNQKKVVFLDEISWLATNKSGFLGALEHFWNSWGSAQPDLLLIICGSATSWIIDKVFSDKGGLHNRVTGTLYLRPFQLHDCELFYEKSNIALNRYQMLESYMIFGGIPYYLSLMRPEFGLAQNVDSLCFAENAILANEFNNLYSALFKQAENHISVVRALSSRTKGLTRNEIIASSGIKNGGSLTKTLGDLSQSGFVRKYKSFGKNSKDSLYQLVDPFTLFFLRFMDGDEYRDGHFWSNYSRTPSHITWRGYAFEQVVLLHIDQIRHALGINGVLSDYSSWVGKVDGLSSQVDLIIDRKDEVINLCEIKYSQTEFEVDKTCDFDLRKKLSVFERSTKTRKALNLTLVTTYGLQRNLYSGIFQNVVTMEDLFSR